MRLFVVKFFVTFPAKLRPEISSIGSNPTLLSAPTLERKAKTKAKRRRWWLGGIAASVLTSQQCDYKVNLQKYLFFSQRKCKIGIYLNLVNWNTSNCVLWMVLLVAKFMILPGTENITRQKSYSRGHKGAGNEFTECASSINLLLRMSRKLMYI